MSTHLKCTECDHIELESDVPVEQIWNSEMRGFDNFLLCSNCHSKEGGFDTAYHCEDCEELEPLVDGTDLCKTCYDKEVSLERDLVALENEHHEKTRGIR